MSLVALATWVTLSQALPPPPRPPRVSPALPAVQALLKQADAAIARGDLEGYASLFDFPVLRVTGEGPDGPREQTWTREEFLRALGPTFANAPAYSSHTRSASITFLSGALATVREEHRLLVGETERVWTSVWVLVRREKKWRFKELAE